MTVNVALQPAEGPALNLPTVDATLTFTERTGEKPYAYAYDPPAGVDRTNIVTLAQTIPIENARSIAHDLSLEVWLELCANAYQLWRDSRAAPWLPAIRPMPLAPKIQPKAWGAM